MSNLETDLLAAGFTPVRLETDSGIVAFTGWIAPAKAEDVYERYYERLKAAMQAQVDRLSESQQFNAGMERELHAVVSAWRSAASIAPVF